MNYAKQITDALQAAHEKGITHRGLKPANIMITRAAVVKVLEFAPLRGANPTSREAQDSDRTQIPFAGESIVMNAAARPPILAQAALLLHRAWSVHGLVPGAVLRPRAAS